MPDEIDNDLDPLAVWEQALNQERAARGLPPRDWELPGCEWPQAMVVYLTLEEDRAILIRARAEDGGRVLERTARPGQWFMGRPFEFWQQLGPGRHEVPLD
jgi:hypothetical protein